MNIVINSCWGGFGLSEEAMEEYKRLAGIKDKQFYDYRIERNDPILVDIVQRLDTKANSEYSQLRIVEVPDGIEWEIEDYDGQESVVETHRAWR